MRERWSSISTEATAAVTQTFNWSIVLKRELSHKAKLLIYQLLYFQILTYEDRTRARIQVVEMNVLQRVAMLAFRNRERSSDIREGPNHVERSQVKWFGQLAASHMFQACPPGR